MTPPDNSPKTTSAGIVAKIKLALAKRQASRAFDEFQRDYGNQSEYRTRALYAESVLVPVDKIVDDPKFANFRLSADSSKIADLQTSIDLEGLRTPITVIEAASPGYYHARAGFRRLRAVRNLGWAEIPAIVLPADTPESEEYWANILENTNREKLSAYEVAQAAKLMRDRFGVSGGDFARKSGHSPEYVRQLLSCADRLPPEVLHSWRKGDRVPFKIYHQLSCMTPLEAIKNLRLFMGQHRIDSSELSAADTLRKLRERKRVPDKLLTVRGVERTQRLLMAVKVSKVLSEREKSLCQGVVEYCQGSRKQIAGVIDDYARSRDVVFEPPERPDVDDVALMTVLPEQPSLGPELDETRRKFNTVETNELKRGERDHGSDKSDDLSR